MPRFQVAIINASTVLQDEEIANVVPAFQKQVSEHLVNVWGVDAALSFVPRGASPPDGAWWLSILDNTDQAAFLGYHDVTNAGLPLGKAFAETDKMFGFNWTITASHELLEMLVDPDINLTVLVQNDNTAGRLYSYEICDPCEADQYAYEIDGVMVSDFIFPAWFQSFQNPGNVQYDVTQQITQPFQLVSGGYISVYDLGAGGGWQQLNADRAPADYTARARVGSRRERRRVARKNWMRSTPRTH
jgi:hypothetical protein